MLRLLSWSSGLAADKIAPQEVDYLAPYRHRSTSIELQKPPILKRKRTDSLGINLSQSPTKRRMEKMAQQFVTTKQAPTEGPSSTLPFVANATAVPPARQMPFLVQGKMGVAQPTQSEHQMDAIQPIQNEHQMENVQLTQNEHQMEDVQPTPNEQSQVRMKPDKQTLRETLNSQISLEILLKHNELRLIDQEIAKCQVALEQLRRCTEIPYPTMGISEAVSQGQGPAVRSSRSTLQPESPAPWGVVDGPYTRHYAKWLLPDPLFDGGASPGRPGLKAPVAKTPTKGRSTRGSFADSSAVAGKSRAQRAGKFQALSSGYSQPKDKAGPMIQKRKSDGLLVKLVCLDCRRDNFSSAQGFINHCRIAHGRNFASHDAAADACGEPMDVDDAGALLGSDGPPSASVAGLVHPLIYSAHLLKQEIPRKPPSQLEDQLNMRHNATPSEPSAANSFQKEPASLLTPSASTPNLSAMLQRLGAKFDLQSMVADMKQPVPVDEPSESEGEEDEESKTPEAPPIGRHPHLTGSMQPARCTMMRSLEIPSGSRKGLSHPRTLQISGNPPVTPSAQSPPRSNALAPYVPAIQSGDMEPSPTNDSNQAPSLVDDDGDDEYEAHSPSYSGSVDTEMRDLDFVVEDGDESGPSTQNRSTDSDYPGTPKQHPSSGPARRASALRKNMGEREEKHVSFVSPSPAREVQAEKKRGDRKRRRL